MLIVSEKGHALIFGKCNDLICHKAGSLLSYFEHVVDDFAADNGA